MASGVRALGSTREPEEWIRATNAARQARAVVAGQLADLLVASDITGGRPHLTQRVVQLGESYRTSDLTVIRAAVMELGVACGAYAVRIDLHHDHPGAFRG